MKSRLVSRLRTFLPTLLAAAGPLLLSASAVHAQNAFSDSFTTNGADSNFTNAAGTWTIGGGTYSVTGNAQAFNFSLVTTAGHTNYTNFSLSFDVPAAYDGGVVFHGDSTAANGLVFIVRPDLGDAYFINRTGGNFGGSILSADTSLSAATGSSLHVTLTGSGNNYTAVVSTTANPTVPIDTVTFNGNATAANYTAGYTGLYSYAGSGVGGNNQFDNLNVVPEPSAWVAALLGGGLLGVVLRLRRRVAAR